MSEMPTVSTEMRWEVVYILSALKGRICYVYMQKGRLLKYTMPGSASQTSLEGIQLPHKSTNSLAHSLILAGITYDGFFCLI